jgi:hypothetical protein
MPAQIPRLAGSGAKPYTGAIRRIEETVHGASIQKQTLRHRRTDSRIISVERDLERV